LRSNALLTLRLAERVLETGTMRFIYLSSGQGYAYAQTPVDETRSLYPTARASYYLGSKLLGEIYVEHLRATRGLHALSLRLGSVYGLGMPESSVVARFMYAARAGKTLHVANGGCSSADFVSVSDVVWAVLEAAQRGGTGVYNVASGVAPTILDLARTITEIFADHQPEVKIQPIGAVVPASFPAIDIAKAKKEWGYRPRGLKEGLIQYRSAMEGHP
jgi:UDP-glucose 4-epimerase